MINPRITVLMSVFNGEKYIRQAILSILNQTFKDFEFLIINDGSTDRTPQILRSYKDSRIKLYNNRENKGLTRSLNIGLRIAKGKYIARMDADDISHPERLEKQISTIVKDREIGMVTSWIDEFGLIKKPSDYFMRVRTYNTPEEIFYTLLFHNCIAHSTVLFRKDLVLSLNGYAADYEQSQDYNLWVKISRISKILKIKEALVARRSHRDTISARNIQQMINSDKIFLKNMSELLSEEINSELLFQIRENNINIRNLKRALLIMNTINKNICRIAYKGLDKRKITQEGNEKIRDMIYSVFINAIIFKDLRRKIRNIYKFDNFKT